MLWAKKNSYKEFDNEKKFLLLENFPPPPITFLMVQSLIAWAGAEDFGLKSSPLPPPGDK